MAFRQSNVAQRGLQSFANDPAVAKPDFVHTCVPVRTQTIPASVDDEHADARKREDRLSAPFLDKLRRRHCETSERSCPGVCEDAAKRDERLSGSALRNGSGAPSLLPKFHDPHDRHRLRRERTPLQLLQCRPDRIVRTMKRRKPGQHQFSQRRTVQTQVIVDGCGCGHDLKLLLKKDPGMVCPRIGADARPDGVGGPQGMVCP